MIKVVAENYLKREYLAEARPLFEELIEKTRLEDGCISYELFADLEDETHLVFVEQWESGEALKAHAQSEHFVRIIGIVKAYAAKEMRVIKLREY